MDNDNGWNMDLSLTESTVDTMIFILWIICCGEFFYVTNTVVVVDQFTPIYLFTPTLSFLKDLVHCLIENRFATLISGGGPIHARVPIQAHPQFS